jgi:hypothetical protein
VRLLEALKRLVDPVGPLGSVLSPADVYKERAGLSVASPHMQRVELNAPGDIQQALAAPRFVSMEEAVDVPRDRVRQVSAYVEEHWTPKMAATESTDLAVILVTSQQQVGWTVTQRPAASTRARKYQSQEEFEQVIQSAQIQASDDIYNGYFETIPGNDPCVINGEVLRGQPVYKDGKMVHDGIVRGGTMIRGGRREYREKTKDMVHWGPGFLEERAKVQAEMESRPVRNVKANMEAMAGRVLPMKRILANPRVDRKSAC